METQSAFIRADSGIVLDAVAFIDLDAAMIIDPSDAEHNSAFRLDQPLDETGLLIFRMLFNNRLDGAEDFMYSCKNSFSWGTAATSRSMTSCR